MLAVSITSAEAEALIAHRPIPRTHVRAGIISRAVRAIGGRRPQLGGRYFRSRWEARYAAYLDWRKRRGEILGWAYEPRTFQFPAIRRGTRDYTPDFWIELPGGQIEWHEVKAWLDPKSRTRLSRFRRYYPAETLVVIGREWFRAAERQGLSAVVPGWEP